MGKITLTLEKEEGKISLAFSEIFLQRAFVDKTEEELEAMVIILSQSLKELDKAYYDSVEDFIEANKQSPVVYGERLTSWNGEVLCNEDMDSSDRVMYKLLNGKEFVVLDKEMANTLHEPKWDTHM